VNLEHSATHIDEVYQDIVIHVTRSKIHMTPDHWSTRKKSFWVTGRR
jgi:hypothetical protein